MTPPRVLLEVCIASVADALAARSGGADRLELNSALWLGGLTPSLGLLIEVKEAIDQAGGPAVCSDPARRPPHPGPPPRGGRGSDPGIAALSPSPLVGEGRGGGDVSRGSKRDDLPPAIPVIAMARPRPGGFRYDEGDFRALRRDVDLMLEHGADGIAFGFLNDDGTIDLDRTRAVVGQIGDRTPVFHRAFDVTPDPFAALEQLIDLGIRRVLTSGQQESAYNGIPLLAELNRRAAGRIEVLPAGGINRFTVKDVIERTGCDQVHASLRRSLPDSSTSARPRIAFGGALRPREDSYETTNVEAVSELINVLK